MADSDWSGQVSHLWFGLEIFPLKIPNFSMFLPLGQKNLIGSGQKVPGSKTGQPLIYCGSKVCSGQGPSLMAKLLYYHIISGIYFLTEAQMNITIMTPASRST